MTRDTNKEHYQMPNLMKTKCLISGSENSANAFRNLHIREMDHGLILDFNSVAPLPSCLVGTQSGSNVDLCLFALGVTKTGKAYPSWCEPFMTPELKASGIKDQQQILAWLEVNRPADVREARRQIRNQTEVGYYDWYEWTRANWGTCKNSFDLTLLPDQPLSFEFWTAWNFPAPVFDALAVLYPELEFDCEYYELVNCWGGRCIYRSGRLEEATSWGGESTDESADDPPVEPADEPTQTDHEAYLVADALEKASAFADNLVRSIVESKLHKTLAVAALLSVISDCIVGIERDDNIAVLRNVAERMRQRVDH